MIAFERRRHDNKKRIGRLGSRSSPQLAGADLFFQQFIETGLNYMEFSIIYFLYYLGIDIDTYDLNATVGSYYGGR